MTLCWLILVISSMLGSIVLTRLLINYAPVLGLIDSPSSRKVHARPTPVGAGLGFVIITTISMAIFENYAIGTLFYSKIILPIFLLISLVSFVDDLRDLSAITRLVIHFFAVFLTVFNLFYPKYQLLHQELPASIDLLIAIFVLVTFLNIYNFMDGIDGITVSESIHLSTTILVLCYLRYDIIIHVNLVIIIGLLVLGYSIGFLPFNWQPARIFIGDVGSISLGFLLGLCLMCLAMSSWHLFTASFISSLYYLADGGGTILIRLGRGEKIWQPHVKHFFQKAVRKGMSHSLVVRKISLCNFTLFILAISSLYLPAISIIISLIIVLITLIHFSK